MRKSNNYEDVLRFFERYRIPKASSPTMLDADTFAFRMKLVDEELAEFKAAHTDSNMMEAADALVDLVYVVMGTAVAMGLPWDQLWSSVQFANMNKVRAPHPNTSKRGSTLDVIKPAGWRPPNHSLALTGIDQCPSCGRVEESDHDLQCRCGVMLVRGIDGFWREDR
jgi:predicted HAD superfamily Cof-like phosphohydrolase